MRAGWPGYYTGGVAYRGSERRCSASFLKLRA